MSGNGDYISREAANEACREAVRRYPNSFYNGIEAARDAILKLPAADVRPVVRGKWKKEFQIIDGYGWYVCTCSRCGMTFKAFNSSNFCPNCGADMREEC